MIEFRIVNKFPKVPMQRAILHFPRLHSKKCLKNKKKKRVNLQKVGQHSQRENVFFF